MRNVIRKLLIGIVLALVVAAGAWWYFAGTAQQMRAAANGPLQASGTLEAPEVTVTAEVAGRVVEVLTREGDTVKAGDVVARLDASLLDSQAREAKAAVAAAQANLNALKAGPRAQEVAVAEAQHRQALAAQEGARRALESAQAVLNNPQELIAQIDQARTAIETGQHHQEQARSQVFTLQVKRDSYPFFSTEYKVLDQQAQAAQQGVAAAQAEEQGARGVLASLERMKANPVALQAQVNQVRGQHDQARSAAQQAQAALDVVRAGATAEQVRVAEAQVKQAEAALGLLQVQRDKLSLRAPQDGVVTKRSVQLGETVQPGAGVFSVANLDSLKLTVYVPEVQIGRVRLGQPVGVRVDAFPGEEFVGTVTFIAQKAEFTPKNVQTKEERIKTVIAVRVKVPNLDHRLKPGLPADATFRD